MQTRSGRWTTVLIVLGALILAAAVYQASRSPQTAEARTTQAQLEQAAKETLTPVGLRSPDAWSGRQALLRTDEQARAYAEDFATLLRTIIPLPDPATFYENASLVRVSLVRGTGPTSVWEARYKIDVGSTEDTFTVVYPSITRFGPGLAPGDKPPLGTEDVYALANLQYFTKQQRVSFLHYWDAKRLNDLHVVARLDRPYPGAPWTEDTQFRASLLEAGKKAGLGPSNLAYYFLDHERAGTLAGYDVSTQTWRELKIVRYPDAKWNAHVIAVAIADAKVKAKKAAATRARAVAATKAKTSGKATARAKTKVKVASNKKVAATPTPASRRQPTGATATPHTASNRKTTTPSTTVATSQNQPNQPVENGGTIPSTATPWYNLLLVGVALLLLGCVGLVRYGRRSHA